MNLDEDLGCIWGTSLLGPRAQLIRLDSTLRPPEQATPVCTLTRTTRIPMHPRPPQCLASSSFLTFASLIVVLNCTPLIILGYISFSTNCLSLSFAPVAVGVPFSCAFAISLLLTANISNGLL